MANEQNLEQRIGEHVLAVRAAQGGVDVLSELVNALEPRDLLEVSERMRRFADAVYYTATACLVKESERALESHLDEVAAESDGMETSIRSGKLRDRAPEEVVAQEIAVIRGIARLTAAGEVERAQLLAHDTPEAIEGLAEGAVSGRHVMTAADLARRIEPERVPEPSSDDPAVLEEHARDEATRRAECAQRRQEFAGDLLAQAGSKTPGQLERYGKRRLEQELSEDFETRNRRARSARFVSIESTDDGMAYLTALIPTLAAEAIDRRLADFAAVQKKAPTCGGDASGDSAGARTIGGLEMDAEEERQRTQQQVKADAFVDLLLGSPEAIGIANVKPEVTITVPVAVLRELEALGGDEARNSSAGVGSMGSLEATDRRAGSGDQTGFRTLRPETERFGAFGQEELAAVLANAATWTRVITDPWDGAIASFDSKAYKPPAALRRALQLRDRTCRVPGCGRRATNCEPDHVIEWRHCGPTDLDNLVSLCKRCHRLKSWGLLTFQLAPDGTLNVETFWGSEAQTTPDAPWQAGSPEPEREVSPAPTPVPEPVPERGSVPEPAAPPATDDRKVPDADMGGVSGMAPDSEVAGASDLTSAAETSSTGASIAGTPRLGSTRGAAAEMVERWLEDHERLRRASGTEDDEAFLPEPGDPEWPDHHLVTFQEPMPLEEICALLRDGIHPEGVVSRMKPRGRCRRRPRLVKAFVRRRPATRAFPFDVEHARGRLEPVMVPPEEARQLMREMEKRLLQDLLPPPF